MATTKNVPVRRKKTTSPVDNKVTLTKAQIAEQKVDELLEGVTKSKENKPEIHIDLLAEAVKDKEAGWAEKQIAGLTEQNQKLSEDYAKLLHQVQQNGGVVTNTEESMKRGVEQIFFELDGVLTGTKFGKPYEEAKIRPLLNKMMQLFPFLAVSLKKKKTITQKTRPPQHRVMR